MRRLHVKNTSLPEFVKDVSIAFGLKTIAQLEDFLIKVNINQKLHAPGYKHHKRASYVRRELQNYLLTNKTK